MLVAIEGIDGAGKHTQSALLVERARAHGLSVALVSYPRYGRGVFAAAIEALLAGELGRANDPRLVGLLFAGDRLEGRAALLEAMASCDLVVADRYVASNLAYQAARAAGERRAAIVEFLARVEFDVFGLPRPDLNVLLDLPLDLALARLSARASGDRPAEDHYESDHRFLAACAAAYAAMAEGKDWAVVAAAGPEGPRCPEAVAGAVWEAVAAHRALREA
ncbi:MAG: dTMP kinase [Actinomycetota bacterium]|nr:dTMP kinase [Actinomycetota bacterium]